MKKVSLLILSLWVLVSCNKEDKLESEIAQIDVSFKVERFDLAFAHANPNDLPKLKKDYPFLFSERVADSVWIARMKDTLQQELSQEVEKTFAKFDDVHDDIESLFQHLKFYDTAFRVPRVITVTSDVDYRHKTIVTDSIVLISLDTYLGADHHFYEGIQRFISRNMDRSQIVSDLAGNYAEKYIYQKKSKNLLDDMIYYGKELYFKDKMVPFVTDAVKIGYTPQQLEWAEANESEMWRYFIERELLYSTDNSLAGRFIAEAPFSKFYLELDSESPDRIGQYLGWQIVRAYMKNNEVSLMDMLQTDPQELFNKSKFKPKK